MGLILISVLSKLANKSDCKPANSDQFIKILKFIFVISTTVDEL